MGPLLEHAIGKPAAIPSKSVIEMVSQLEAKTKISESERSSGSFSCGTAPLAVTNFPSGSLKAISSCKIFRAASSPPPAKSSSTLCPRSRSFLTPRTTTHWFLYMATLETYTRRMGRSPFCGQAGGSTCENIWSMP